MPTTIETRIRRTAAKKVRVQITGRSRSNGGFDVTYPTGRATVTLDGASKTVEFDHETVKVKSKKEALALLIVRARLTSELVFKIVPHRVPSKAAQWCDACQSNHPVPQTEAEHNELQCLKQWKEPK